MSDSDVLIVGAGPVGLTLAIDLAWRGIEVTVAERRARTTPPKPKCNHVAARTVEIFRKLGLAERVHHAAGRPPARCQLPNQLHRRAADGFPAAATVSP